MKITEETYLEMKKLIAEYECDQLNKQETENPYLETVTIKVDIKYNDKYGDDRECKCGHAYYRHFDTYEDMEAIGCKYCQCFLFDESIPEKV